MTSERESRRHRILEFVCQIGSLGECDSEDGLEMG